MDLFCRINSAAGWSDGGAETALVPVAILLEFLNQTEEQGLDFSGSVCFELFYGKNRLESSPENKLKKKKC